MQIARCVLIFARYLIMKVSAGMRIEVPTVSKPRKYGMPQGGKKNSTDTRWARRQAQQRAKEHISMAPIIKAVCGGCDSGCIQDIVNAGLTSRKKTR